MSAPPSLDELVAAVTGNPLVSTLVAAALVAAVGGARRWSRDRREAARIQAFLEESARTTKHEFRSTEAISAHTRIPRARVERLCLAHPRIRRNAGARETWRLAD